MKKKILTIAVIGCLTTMIGINLSVETSIENGIKTLIGDIEALASGEGGSGIPIHIGPNYCTCKGSVCQDGNYIGFRPVCGSGSSNIGCREFGGSCR